MISIVLEDCYLVLLISIKVITAGTLTVPIRKDFSP